MWSLLLSPPLLWLASMKADTRTVCLEGPTVEVWGLYSVQEMDSVAVGPTPTTTLAAMTLPDDLNVTTETRPNSLSTPSAPLGGSQGVPVLDEIYSPGSRFCVCPGVSSQLIMSRKGDILIKCSNQLSWHILL